MSKSVLSLKIIKSTNRASLAVNALDDLLEIFVEGPLDCFSADPAVELWWSSCSTTRRVNQGPRKPYRPRSGSSTAPGPQSEPEEVHLALDDWDNLFGGVNSDIHPSDSDDHDEFMDI